MLQTGPLIALIGPTASGKSQLGLELARSFDGEIICVDTGSFYRQMDIGTAKPSRFDQAELPHHMLDIIDADTRLSVQKFVQLTKPILTDIWSRKKPIFLVGGSGLYIDALLFDYQFRTEKQAASQTANMDLEELQTAVQQAYPAEYRQVDIKNRRRLEQLLRRGPAHTTDRSELAYNALLIGLSPSRSELTSQIKQRTAAMLQAGFRDEVEALLTNYGPDCPGLQITGYAQMSSVILGQSHESDLEDCINQVTLQLAKKQLTWFRRNPAIHWLEAPSNAKALVTTYLDRWSLQ